MSVEIPASSVRRQILLVEDSPTDVEITKRAMAKAKLAHELSVATDGAEAIAFLRREAPYEDAPRPDLILLDLNLPIKDGREVLAEIKEDPVLRLIPVVVLTSSEAERDVRDVYALHANAYAVKPLQLDRFIDMIATLGKFWFSMATLPPKEAASRKDSPARIRT